MNTKITVTCDIVLDMGSHKGYHVNDTMNELQEAYKKKAIMNLNEALKNTGLTICNPRFRIVIGED